MTKIEHLNAAQAICRHPRLWTVNGTLAEVLSTFNGYESAFKMRYPPEADGTLDSSPCKVMRWLIKEFGTQPGSDLKSVVTQLLARYETDEAALAAIGEYAATLGMPKDS